MVRALLSGVALVAIAATAQNAQAQTAAAPASGAASAGDAAPIDDSGLQAIVVTATRRSVNLQKVTATVEAVPAVTLKDYNITGVLQLPSLVSGLVVTPAGGNNIYLRGIGSTSTGYNEAQVAVYVDGVYLANPALGIYSFNNIDQIEVLKGPQGTLYGRNVTGGLISVATRDPSATAHVDASVGYANYNTFSANFYGTAPLTDNLAANIAVFHQKQSDGWSTNVFNGQSDQKSEETGVETKLAWKPAPATKVLASLIYDYNNRDTGLSYEVYPGTVGTDGTPYLGQYRNTSRIQSSAPFRAYIGSVKISQDFAFAKLLSTTAYQNSRSTVTFQAGLPILGQPVAGEGATYDVFYETSKTWSQELQLTSNSAGSRLDWVAGLFYYNDQDLLQLSSYNTCVGAVCAPGFTPNTNTGLPTTKSYSGYGDLTYRFFSATRFTAGLRYTDETKNLSGLVTPYPGQPNSVATLPAGTVLYPGQPFAGFPNGIPTRLHFDKLTYRFVLAQDLTDQIHAYVSHNLGFKSGAFNANSFTNPPVKPELLYATEAGLKSELFDHHLRLNLAYFHYNYQDVQVRSQAAPALPGVPILENAAREKMDGVDGDFSFTPLSGLVLNGSFEFLRAKYADFPGASCVTPGTKVVNGVTIGKPTTVICNLAGYDVPFAAPFSASIGLVYTLNTSVGKFAFSANDHYNSRYSMVADASMYQNKHHIVDLSLNWAEPAKRYDVNLFVRNLTKQYVYAVATESSNFTVVPGAPRTFGIMVGTHF